MAVSQPRYQFTVDDYHHMASAGILSEDDRVELIEGEIYAMSPIGSRHMECVTTLIELLVRTIGRAGRVTAQNPLRLGDLSEPEPDVMVLQRRSYADALPTVADVLLLIEVADTSLAYDRDVKIPLYAQAGIPEVWLVDLNSQSVTRYLDPQDGVYQHITRYDRGDRVAAANLPNMAVAVDDLFA